MRLSPEELERLEAMCAAGQVRSDPPTLSATDRMLETMSAAARARAKPRPAPPRPPSCPAAARDTPPARRRLPARLEDLLEIRRALLRGETPEL